MEPDPNPVACSNFFDRSLKMQKVCLGKGHYYPISLSWRVDPASTLEGTFFLVQLWFCSLLLTKGLV